MTEFNTNQDTTQSRQNPHTYEDGQEAYRKATRANVSFPRIRWSDNNSELLFRTIQIVEDNPELLIGFFPSFTSFHVERQKLGIRAEVAEKLLGQLPAFQMLFLNHKEAARYAYGKRIADRLREVRRMDTCTKNLSDDLVAHLRQKAEGMVSNLTRLQQNTRIINEEDDSKTLTVISNSFKRGPRGSGEPVPATVEHTTKSENAKRATEPVTIAPVTKPETADHTIELKGEIPGEEYCLPVVPAGDQLESTIQKLFNEDALGIHGQVTTNAAGEDSPDATNSFSIAHGISELMVPNLMEHQDQETEPASDRASVLGDHTSSDSLDTNTKGSQEASAEFAGDTSRDGESKSNSVLSDSSDNSDIEFEDALQPLNTVDRDGGSFPGTPMAVDEVDHEAKTPTLSPNNYGSVSQNVQILELSWPTGNRGSNDIHSAETRMGGDRVVDEAYSDTGAGSDLPHLFTMYTETDEDDSLNERGIVRPEESGGNQASSPMALASEAEEDSGNSRADTGMPRSVTPSPENNGRGFQSEHSLVRGWSKDNEGAGERLLPASRKRNREDSEDEEDVNTEQFIGRKKRMKHRTNRTPVAHSGNKHLTPEHTLENVASGQGVVDQALSQQDDDTMDIS